MFQLEMEGCQETFKLQEFNNGSECQLLAELSFILFNGLANFFFVILFLSMALESWKLTPCSSQVKVAYFLNVY